MWRINMESKQHEIILYQIDDANICINVIYEDETFWLTQKAIPPDSLDVFFDCYQAIIYQGKITRYFIF